MINLLGNYKNEEVSKYNVVIENEDGYVCYNQISGSLILFNKDQFEEYRKLMRGNFFVDAEFIKTLRNNGIIKSKNLDEVNFMEEKYKEIKNKSYNKYLTIVPTDKCNLGCFYCYEDKAQWKNMSEETIEKTKIFIKTFLESSPTNILNVTWFGGEPTLNLSAVEDLSLFIDEICKKNKIVFTQDMISNGTNMNEKVIERLKKINVKQYQITVDGFKEDHDVARPFLASMKIEDMSPVQIEQRRKINPNFGKFLNVIGQEPFVQNKKSTYDQIINNLILMRKNGFTVSLRCNINENNIENHHKLLEHLDSLELTKEHESGGVVTPYVAHIFNHEGNKNLRDKLSRESFAEFEMKSKKCGSTAATANLVPFTGESCVANKKFTFCISQSGKLSKCWHHVSNEKHVIGDVEDLSLAKIGSIDEFSPFDDEECRACSVLPSCLGGCKEGNAFYEKGYDNKNYHGCSTLKWNMRARVNLLYQNQKNNNKD
jgi:uncharacterized protein